MYPTAEILFPLHLVPKLKDLRGPKWQKLVEHVASLPETHPDALAFALMMIRLNECLNCHRQSYKYQRGCLVCSSQTIIHYKGTEEELLEHYEKARRDIERYIKEGKLKIPEPVTEG